MLYGVSSSLKQSVDKSQSSKEVMEYRITLEENTHGSKIKKSKLKNIIERCMDVFAEPDHKVGETDHLEVNTDIVEDENNLYVWAVQEYSDWNLIMSNCRLPSFDKSMKSFSFKLVNDLLPNEERLSRILPHNSPLCTHCQNDTTADSLHVFFLCSLSQDLGGWVLRVVRKVDPTATPEAVLRLKITGGDALVWFTVRALTYIWENRSNKKKAMKNEFKSLCDLTLYILLNSKYKETAMLAKTYLPF